MSLFMGNVSGTENYRNDVKRWGGFRHTPDDTICKEGQVWSGTSFFIGSVV